MDSELLYTIKKALEYYDIKKNNFVKLVGERNIKKIKKASYLNEITFGEVKFDYEIIGIFDENTQVWSWAYSAPFVPSFLKKESEFIHNYGLKQNIFPIQEQKNDNAFKLQNDLFNEDGNLEQISVLAFYLKTIFVNSRILINNDLELDIILGLVSYLLKDRIRFIYPDSNDGIITYYLLKNIV